jgi:hypothetical protein
MGSVLKLTVGEPLIAIDDCISVDEDRGGAIKEKDRTQRDGIGHRRSGGIVIEQPQLLSCRTL